LGCPWPQRADQIVETVERVLFRLLPALLCQTRVGNQGQMEPQAGANNRLVVTPLHVVEQDVAAPPPVHVTQPRLGEVDDAQAGCAHGQGCASVAFQKSELSTSASSLAVRRLNWLQLFVTRRARCSVVSTLRNTHASTVGSRSPAAQPSGT